jgi:hypothetical protein
VFLLKEAQEKEVAALQWDYQSWTILQYLKPLLLIHFICYSKTW